MFWAFAFRGAVSATRFGFRAMLPVTARYGRGGFSARAFGGGVTYGARSGLRVNTGRLVQQGARTAVMNQIPVASIPTPWGKKNRLHPEVRRRYGKT